MRRVLLFVGLTLALSLPAQGQVIARWHFGGGLAFPAAPGQFYDYWKQGYHLMVGVELAGQIEFIQVITAEWSYFPFDADRFLKRTGVNPSFSKVSGSGSMIFSAAYTVWYTFRDFPSFQPSFFLGLGGAASIRSSATVEYPLYKASQDGTNSFVPIIPFGISVELYHGESNTVGLAFQYVLGLTKSQTINSNFSNLKLDLAFQ